MSEEDIRAIFQKALLEFPVVRVNIDLPEWVRTLPEEHAVIAGIEEKLRAAAAKLTRMQDCFALENIFGEADGFSCADGVAMDLGKGVAEVRLEASAELYFKVLSEECGESIGNDSELLAYIKSLAEAKRNYDKIKAAMEEADECGYGAVPAFQRRYASFRAETGEKRIGLRGGVPRCRAELSCDQGRRHGRCRSDRRHAEAGRRLRERTHRRVRRRRK